MKEKFFYSIKEVSEILNIPKSTLRFWEKSFKEISPQRTSGKRRLYKIEDIEILQRIKHLLHEEGLSIEGARKKLHLKKTDSDEIISELDKIKKLLEGR